MALALFSSWSTASQIYLLMVIPIKGHFLPPCWRWFIEEKIMKSIEKDKYQDIRDAFVHYVVNLMINITVR
ncbi:Uncharacterised protein [Salmonella enterica subsp. enterica]|uniref:Uncharacterized protein n=1 Tax=Salmonella enterica I TaxID=59201 RepID=A0A447PH25_SALET|nr:Uncharacterised protein [Salmonella enterica subsp. enterica]